MKRLYFFIILTFLLIMTGCGRDAGPGAIEHWGEQPDNFMESSSSEAVNDVPDGPVIEDVLDTKDEGFMEPSEEEPAAR